MGRRETPESLLRSHVTAIEGGPRDHDALLDRIGDARFVLLGAATHGTHELAVERARITRRLIEEKGFDALVIEADWPDAHRLHRWVQGTSSDANAEEALRAFGRFPAWLWRNTETVELLSWLREHNDGRPSRTTSAMKVGVYGMDLYSLYASVEAVLAYLERIDPSAVAAVRARLATHGRLGGAPRATGLLVEESVEDEVVSHLLDMRRITVERARDDHATPPGQLLHVEQHAHLVKSAGEYYRLMFRDPRLTWNLRERHMADTIATVVQHLDHALGRPSKICVWAHNSHLGDARAMELAWSGELSVGRLLRERYERDAFLVGCLAYEGEVTAASAWDAPAERKPLPPALEGSWEALFHAVGVPAFAVLPDDEGHLPDVLRRERLERAIGVVMGPEDPQSHWRRARLADQFDAVIHIDQTRALEALEKSARWHGPDAPETFPFAV